MRAEINEIETKKTIEKINETKSWFFEKINKIDKLLAWLIKKKERGLKSIILQMKREKLHWISEKYKGSWDHNMQLYANKTENLEEMDKFLKECNLTRLNPDEIEIWTDQSQVLKLKLWWKNFQQTKVQEQMASQANSIKHLEKS